MNEPLHERMRMTIAPNSPWRLTRGIVANWSEEVSILLSELAQAKADAGALQRLVAHERGCDECWTGVARGQDCNMLDLAALPENLRGAANE